MRMMWQCDGSAQQEPVSYQLLAVSTKERVAQPPSAVQRVPAASARKAVHSIAVSAQPRTPDTRSGNSAGGTTADSPPLQWRERNAPKRNAHFRTFSPAFRSRIAPEAAFTPAFVSLRVRKIARIALSNSLLPQYFVDFARH